MAKQVRFRAGSSADHSNFTGAASEVTVDSDKKVLIVHDGSKQGGYELVGTAVTQTLSNKQFTGVTTFTGNVSLGTTNPVGQLQVSSGPVIIGAATSTGTASQRLQVTGGAYISGSVGIGTTNPTSALTVKGNTSLETLNVSGISTFSNTIRFQSSATFSDFARVKFGDGEDLEIVHDGDNSSIYNSTGRLDISSNNGIYLYNTGQSYIKCLPTNFSVELYYNNSKKFQTLGTGVTVTGTTFTNQLSVSGGGYFSGNVGIGTTIATEALSVLPKLQILNNSNADGRIILRAKPGNSYRWNIDNDGSTNDLRFFREDDADAANGTVPLSITPTGNATLSGNLNAAGNYFVKIARTSNQTITSGADTLIGFSTVTDSNGWFNASNNRITPTVAGNYYISAMVNWAAGSATNVVQSNIQIRKTGTTIALSQIGIQTHPYTMNVCAIATLNGSTDYIEFTAYTGNPTSQVVSGDATGTLTKLELFKLN
jgi:hypothetical protein